MIFTCTFREDCGYSQFTMLDPSPQLDGGGLGLIDTWSLHILFKIRILTRLLRSVPGKFLGIVG